MLYLRKSPKSRKTLYLRKSPKAWKTQTPGINIGKNQIQQRKTLYLGKLRKKLSPQKIQVFHKPFLADPTEDTEVPEQTVSEEIEITDTIDVTEVITGIPEPTLEVTSEKKEESTSPGSLQKENPEIQNNSEDTTGIDAEQVNKKTHKHPETNNSLVNKIFSVFRQAKESMEIIPL